MKTRLSDGGFNMRKWTSNSKELMEELRKDATKFGMEPVTRDGNPTSSEGTYVNDIMPESNHKLLGQTWNTTTDVLTIDLTKILTGVNADVVTKRIILSTTAKFYDPLGFISPVVLMFKLFFQQLCKETQIGTMH